MKDELIKILESKSKLIFMSYSNEGIMEENDIITLMDSYGKVTVFKQEHKKYKSNINNNSKTVYELLFCLEK